MGTRKNVTLSLPEPLLREFRVYAAVRNESMTSLLTAAIQNMLGHDKDTDRARLRFLARARKSPNRGTKGKIPWTRAELLKR